MELKQTNNKIKKLKIEIKKLKKEMEKWEYLDVAIDSVKRNKEVYKLKAGEYLRDSTLPNYRDNVYNPQIKRFENAIKKLEKLKG